MTSMEVAGDRRQSSGPLVDRCGAVVGINTFISEEAQSIGFAVPINAVKAVMKELREFGKVVRPWLGIFTTALLVVGATILVQQPPPTEDWLAIDYESGGRGRTAFVHKDHVTVG